LRLSLTVTILSLLLGPGDTYADIVRCEVSNRSHYLMPEWIEYELRDRETVVDIRDAVGVEHGIDWVTGKVVDNSALRRTFSWDVGMLPVGRDWPGKSARVRMRMTWLANGTIQVIGVPSLVAYGTNTRYQGVARCSG
jgi:hypothetical protein